MSTKTATPKMAKAAKPIRNPRGGFAADMKKPAPASAVTATAKTDAVRKPAKAEKKTAKAKTDGKLSRTAYMDSLFTGEFTKAEIIAKTIAAYPPTAKEAKDYPKVIATRANERPYWIRKAGNVAKWKEAPETK
jgi:hypothetical protein